MSDGDGKRIPDILDYGDAHEDFVDELARIDEDGIVSHLIFTRRTRAAHNNSTLERKVIARLIVPTHMVKLMGPAATRRQPQRPRADAGGGAAALTTKESPRVRVGGFHLRAGALEG